MCTDTMELKDGKISHIYLNDHIVDDECRKAAKPKRRRGVVHICFPEGADILRSTTGAMNQYCIPNILLLRRAKIYIFWHLWVR